MYCPLVKTQEPNLKLETQRLEATGKNLKCVYKVETTLGCQQKAQREDVRQATSSRASANHTKLAPLPTLPGELAVSQAHLNSVWPYPGDSL